MSVSSSELLRRRLESMPKVIAPRPLGDASMVTQKRKFAACAGQSYGTRSDGSGVIPSTESILLARAGCSVCNDAPQVTTTVDCCQYPVPDPKTKPLALQGTMACPCPTFQAAKPAPLPECCDGGYSSYEEGYSNTLRANHIRSRPPGGWPMYPTQRKPRCQQKPTEPCFPPESNDGGYNVLYWDTVAAVNEQPQSNPCGSC